MVSVIKKHLQYILPGLVAGGSEQTPSYFDTECIRGEHISLTHEQRGYFAFNHRIFSFLNYLVKKASRSLKILYYPLMFNLYWDLRMPLY